MRPNVGTIPPAASRRRRSSHEELAAVVVQAEYPRLVNTDGMGGRSGGLLMVALTLILAGCGLIGSSKPAPGNSTAPFTAVELPRGSVPVVLAVAGDAVLVGVRRDGQPLVPGLLRRGSDGTVSKVPVQAVTPYGVLAAWRSIASDGDRVVALGGERGGAHGHVRWSVWSGSVAGLGEQRQGFSTFGGYEAGDLVDVVLTPAGPALVGGWASATLGFDVAVWTLSGDTWTRQSSAGTALESTQQAQEFPMAATALGQGVLVAGWQLALDAGGRQQPVVWRSDSGATGWTKTVLPDAGQAGAAVAARCQGAVCGVAGRVDGSLAVWRSDSGTWSRLGGVPSVAVGDNDRLVAPLEVGDRTVQVVSDRGQVKIASTPAGTGGGTWTVRAAAGPSGTVTAAAVVANTLYLLAGPDENTQTLWRADPASIH